MDAQRLLALLLLLTSCAHEASRRPVPTLLGQPVVRDAPRDARIGNLPIECTGEGARVSIAPGFARATYFQDGVRVGSSDCGGTRIAVYNMECGRAPEFQFYFASIPGPQILKGKSARLRSAKGEIRLLECHEQTVSPASYPAVTCGGEHLFVERSPGDNEARVFEDGVDLGTAKCLIVAAAIYSRFCSNQAFALYLAEVPGPKALGGKSAEIRLGARPPQLLDCRRWTAR